jgi:hypothetical protein
VILATDGKTVAAAIAAAAAVAAVELDEDDDDDDDDDGDVQMTLQSGDCVTHKQRGAHGPGRQGSRWCPCGP